MYQGTVQTTTLTVPQPEGGTLVVVVRQEYDAVGEPVGPATETREVIEDG